MTNIGTPHLSFNPPPISRRVDRVHGRGYRTGPVRTRQLPTALVRSTGLLTHQGTPREEWPILARALYLQAVADGSDADALQYVNGYTGTVEQIEQLPGTFQKSGQGFTEDVRRLVYHKATPEDGMDDPDLRRDYERTRHALRRIAPYLQNHGPVVHSDWKLRRDTNGRRWSVAQELRRAPAAAAPAPSVRCTGPEPRVDWNAPYIDVGNALARIVAHRDQLHTAFTEGLTCKETVEGFTRHRPRHALRSQQWHARQGSNAAAFVSVGRWRKGEADRTDTRTAVTVPWIVFELDGRDSTGRKSRDVSVRLARRLVRRLLSYGAEESALQVSYSGNASIHVRLSHTAIGCPIYRTAAAAESATRRLVDGICAGLPDVRAAVDDRLFRPRQMIRVIGGTHQRGTRCTPVSIDELLHAHPLRIYGHSEAAPHTPYTLADPNAVGSFIAALHRLATRERSTTNPPKSAKGLQCCKARSAGPQIAPLMEGVSEGERNDSAYIMALYLLTYGRGGPDPPWEQLQDWNQRNTPPLPVGELRRVYTSATRSRAVMKAGP